MPRTANNNCTICGVNKTSINTYKRTNYSLRSICKLCYSIICKKRYINNKLSILCRTKKHSRVVKQKVLKHYGKGVVACVKCGYNDTRALSIDHINGNGIEHLKSIGMFSNTRSGGGYQFYLWLIRNNFPEGYQTLCMNCQWVKRETNNELGVRPSSIGTVLC
jgi:Zn ribbon nucleic-acid-binding protein